MPKKWKDEDFADLVDKFNKAMPPNVKMRKVSDSEPFPNAKVYKQTKPPVRNPRLTKRNKEIAKKYAKYRIDGLTAKVAKEKLSEEFELAVSTIDTYL